MRHLALALLSARREQGTKEAMRGTKEMHGGRRRGRGGGDEGMGASSSSFFFADSCSFVERLTMKLAGPPPSTRGQGE